MSIVKCLYCQEKFDREKIKYQKIGRRYAHLTCHEPRVDVDGTNYQTIIHYCSKLFGDKTNFIKIGKQIKEYITLGLTYDDIYLTLKYWYEIKKESIEKSQGGIGIVQYVCKEAKDYWKLCNQKIPKMEEEIIEIKHKKSKSLLERMLEE